MISTINAGGMECPSDIRLNVKTIVSPATANVEAASMIFG